MLGSILALSAGEVTGLLSDQQRSVFDLGSSVVHVDVSSASVSAEEQAALGDQLYESLSGSNVTVVFDAHGNDGPRLGIFDGAGEFSSIESTSGSVLTRADYLSQDLRIMVRSDSYIAKQIRESGDSGILPDSTVVTGTFAASSAPFDVDYVYNLFSTPSFKGSFYIKADEAGTADNIVQMLRSAGLTVTPSPILGPADYVQSTRGAVEIEVMAGLLVVSLALLFFDAATAQRNRWRVSKLFGATPMRIGWEEGLRSTLGVGLGLAIGASLTSVAAALWMPMLAAPPEIIGSLVITCAVLAGLLSAPLHFLASRSTSLVK